jgi:hypothetical protein
MASAAGLWHGREKELAIFCKSQMHFPAAKAADHPGDVSLN